MVFRALRLLGRLLLAFGFFFTCVDFLLLRLFLLFWREFEDTELEQMEALADSASLSAASQTTTRESMTAVATALNTLSSS